MQEPNSENPPHGATMDDGRGVVRQTSDFLVMLAISILIFRTFAAEAYVVPTGSMAPTLLGLHKDIVCTNCGLRFALGMDEQGRSGRPVCPNCGQDDLRSATSVECNGDRLLVQKFLFDFRAPRRWEVAVFQSPNEPMQAYVKRVVALPGESVQIVDGDIFINGKVAHKTLTEQRAMRIAVYDHNHVPRDSDRYPRWMFRPSSAKYAGTQKSGWMTRGARFFHETSPELAADQLDWLEYTHWEPDRSKYGPVLDFASYNGMDLRGENPVPDLFLEAKLAPGSDLNDVSLRLSRGADRFVVSLPVDGRGKLEVRRNGRLEPLLKPGSGLISTGKPQHVEASLFDRRLTVVVDGVVQFEPIDFLPNGLGPRGFASPIGIGVKSGHLDVSDVKLFRDVYYTSSLANTPRRPFGVETPYVLGKDEFFVLGDNSAVSNDSRFWDESPVVPRGMFLGKPFLVHLPGQVVPLRVFGQSVYWVPDPREIRYIR